jgi:uncharacterized protein YqfA (UPF0365 family)
VNDQNLIWIAFGIVIVMVLAQLCIFAWFAKIWMQCLLAGAQVSLLQLIGMKLRGSPVKHLCELYIMSRQAGLDVKLYQLESGYKAGADVELVVRAMIKASQTGQNLTWEEALSQAKKNQYVDYVEENYGDGA